MNDAFNTVEVPAGLESRLDALIDRLENEEKRVGRRRRWWAAGAAASAAVLIVAGMYLGAPSRSEQEAARDALALVAKNLNKGMEQLALAIDEIEKSSRTINKTLKR